jgi:hypothetical protein
MEMIKEVVLEKATLFRMEGAAFELINKKIIGLMKNAGKLEMDISAEEFKMLQDKANRQVFEISKRELRLTNIASKATGAPHLLTKKKKLIKLLERLKAESKIEEDLGIADSDKGDSIMLAA